MMKVTVTDMPQGGKQLEIVLNWDEVAGDHADLMKRYSRVPVRGFRPGKTPSGLIESTFRSQIETDLAAGCCTRFCRSAMAEHGLEAGSPVEVSDAKLSKGESLSFRAEFIEMPRFELPDYASLDLKSEEVEDILDEISEKLLAATQIELPEALVHAELKYSETEGETPTAEERDTAAQRASLMLILRKIAAQDNIVVDERDLDDRIAQVAAENGLTAQGLKQYLVQNGGLGRLSDSLLFESVLAYIAELNDK